jgi:hypothetical protein
VHYSTALGCSKMQSRMYQAHHTPASCIIHGFEPLSVAGVSTPSTWQWPMNAATAVVQERWSAQVPGAQHHPLAQHAAHMEKGLRLKLAMLFSGRGRKQGGS